MNKPKQIKGYHAILLAGLLVTTSLPAFADDYMPPPLFGASATVTKAAPEPEPIPVPTQPAPIVTVGKPHLPDLPAPVAATPKSFPSTEPLVHPTAPPPPMVAAAPVTAPEPSADNDMTVEGLLAHPADRVDPRAQAAINKPSTVPARPAGLAQPILDGPPKVAAAKPDKPKPKAIAKADKPKPAPKPDAPATNVAVTPEPPKPTPVEEKPIAAAPALIAAKPEPASVAAATPAPASTPAPTPAPVAAKPAVVDKSAPPALMDYAMPDLSKDKPVNTTVPTIAATPTPVKESVIRTEITSPSPTVKKMIESDPKVMVYSRDKATGEFKRVNRDDIVQYNKGWSKNYEVQKMPAPAEVQAAPTPKVDEVDSSIAWPPRMPPPLPTKTPAVSSTETVAKELATMVPPLGLDDLAPKAGTPTRNMPALPITTVTATKLTPTINEIAAIPSMPPTPAPVAAPIPVSSAASKLASIAPAAASATEPTMITLHYKPEATDLDNAKRQQMDKTILKALMDNRAAKLEIRAYAAPKAGQPQSDRRTALNRGLAVREYLVSQGVPGNRMDLRVMGQVDSGTIPERVELTAQ